MSFEKQNFQEHTRTDLEEELENIKETAIRDGKFVYNDNKFTYALAPNKKVSSLPENL